MFLELYFSRQVFVFAIEFLNFFSLLIIIYSVTTFWSAEVLPFLFDDFWCLNVLTVV